MKPREWSYPTTSFIFAIYPNSPFIDDGCGKSVHNSLFQRFNSALKVACFLILERETSRHFYT